MRLMLLTAVAVAAALSAPAPALAIPPPVEVYTNGTCSEYYPDEVVSVGRIYVCSNRPSLDPNAEIHTDGSPCPDGWIQVGVGGEVKICVDV